MCKYVEIQRDAVPSNIRIEFERDSSLRATEIFVSNRDKHGVEQQGVILVAFDSGRMAVGKPNGLGDAIDFTSGGMVYGPPI